MKLVLTDRFLRMCEGLSEEDQTLAVELVLGIRKTLANPKSYRGIGMRKIHAEGIWEVRIGLSLRAVLKLSKNEAVLLTIGTHDAVKRFLRSL